MKPLVFLFSFFPATFSFAQVKIVKDNTACKYGLKNGGEWIIKPEYTFISYFNFPYEKFLLLKDNKYALADSKGVLITDLKYDRIHPVFGSMDFYTIVIGKYQGILDENAKEIISPEEYTNIQHITDDYFICTQYKKKFLFKGRQKINTHGVDHIERITIGSKEDNFVLQNFSKKSTTATLLNSRNNFDTLITGKNTFITGYHNHFIIQFPDSTLIFDKDFKKIYSLKFPGIYYGDIFFPYEPSAQTFRFKQKQKFGIGDINGNVMVPPIYESINLYSNEYPEAKYSVTQNGRIGFMDAGFNVSIKPEYDPSQCRHYQNFILLSKENKYAVYDVSAKKILSENYTYINNEKYHLLYDSSSIYRLNSSYNPRTADSLLAPLLSGEFVVKAGMFSIYKFGSEYVPLAHTGEKLWINASMAAEYNNNLYTIYYHGSTYKFNSDGIQIIEEKKNVISYHLTQKINTDYSVYRENGKYGILNHGTQIPFLNAEFEHIIPASDTWVWIKKGPDADCRFKEPQAGNWYLCQLDGTQVVDIVFDIPASVYRYPTTVYTNNKCGVYDFTNKRFILDPIYDYMSESSPYSTLSFLFDYDGSFLVLNYKKEPVSDKKWKYMVKTNRPMSFPSHLGYSSSASTFSLFINDSDTLALSAFGDTTSYSPFIRTLIFDGNYLTEKDEGYYRFEFDFLKCNSDVLKNYKTTLDEAFARLIRSNQFPIKFVPYSEWTHTSLVTDISNPNSNLRFHIFTPPAQPHFAGRINYCNEDYVSIANSYTYNGHTRYFNFHRAYGYLFEFELEELFLPDANIEDAMIILLTEAIYHREDLFLDCHNPATIFDRTGKNFYFDESGLHFTIQDEQRTKQDIIITWQKLKKYAPEKGIVADFLKLEVH